jgi:hypothetical protein
MTPYQAKFLAHVLHLHSLESSYAMKSARHLAKLDPFQLADLPEMFSQALEGQQRDRLDASSQLD